MTIKTKASRQLWMVKAKNCFLNADSRVQLGCSGAAFSNTSSSRVDAKLILFFFFLFIMSFGSSQQQKTRGGLARQKRRLLVCVPPPFPHPG